MSLSNRIERKIHLWSNW